MGNPSQSRNQRENSGVYLGPTRGKSSPKNSRRGCLCIDSNTYSRRCCGGALIQQGIGQIEFPPTVKGGFSRGFSSGFNIS